MRLENKWMELIDVIIVNAEAVPSRTDRKTVAATAKKESPLSDFEPKKKNETIHEWMMNNVQIHIDIALF